MSRRRFEAFGKNAPGDFYVEKDMCISCGTPQSGAPDLIEFSEDDSAPGGRLGQCYFKKQPSTPQELDRAIEALRLSCCGAYRYAGNDSAVKEKLCRLNSADTIDHPH
jgi:hypothetical protein